MSRRQRILHRLTWLLVATIGAIAFTASFEAIADYAGQVGWGPLMKYAAPLLVDTFTVAAGLVILARAEDGVRAVYAWCLLIAAAAVSVGLNIAHAPEHLSARFVAALPPAALLAAVELAMSEARRSRKTPTPQPIRETAGVGEQEREAGPTTMPPAPAAKPAPVSRVSGAEQEREVRPTVPPAPAVSSPRVRPHGGAPAPEGTKPAAAPSRVAPTARGGGAPERNWSADLKNIERRRIIRSELAEDMTRSANSIKFAFQNAEVGPGESGAFYALVEQLRSEMRQESNGAPERAEVDV